MGRININDLRTEMILSGELLAPNGRFLLPGGTVLEEKHIKIMKTWGVIEAEIKGLEQEDARAGTASEIDPEALRETEEYLRPLFILNDLENEVVREIYRLCVLRTARKPAARRFTSRAEMGEGMPEVPSSRKDMFQKGKGSARDLVKYEVELASFPDIYFQIMEVLDSPRSSSSYVADVISKDASLSAKLLRLVNTPFYGFPSKIDSISRAVTIVGINELTTLAKGIAVIHFFKDVPSELIDMKNFWKHSISCGVFAKVLAGHKIGLIGERFFVAGLIHDVGRILMLKKFPHAMTEAIFLSRKEAIPIFEAERETIGFDHAKVGGLLLKEWRFPDSLENSVKYHHSPSSALNPLDPSIVNVADMMARALRCGSCGLLVPALQEGAWETMDLSPGVLATVVNQADRQSDEIVKAFLHEDEEACGG